MARMGRTTIASHLCRSTTSARVRLTRLLQHSEKSILVNALKLSSSMNSKTFGQPHFYFTVLVSTGVAVHIESAVTLEAQIFSMPGIFQCPDFSNAQIFFDAQIFPGFSANEKWHSRVV